MAAATGATTPTKTAKRASRDDPARTDEIEISGSPSAFSTLLSSVYSGVLRYRTEEEAEAALEMAARLGMHGLLEAAAGADTTQCLLCSTNNVEEEEEEEEEEEDLFDDYDEPLTLRITPEMVLTEEEEEEEEDEDDDEYNEAVLIKTEEGAETKVKKGGGVSGGGRLCMCKMCGKTLRGLTAYKRHLVLQYYCG